MIRDSRQPVEAHLHVVSDFRREIYDNSLAHLRLADSLTQGAFDGTIEVSKAADGER